MKTPSHRQPSLPFDERNRLRVQVLGSSSAGNCTLVWDDDDAVLIDCGFGPRYVQRGLRAVGLDISCVSALIVTHVHGDHVHDLTANALADAGVPIVCPDAIRRPLVRGYPSIDRAAKAGLLRSLRSGEASVGTFDVEAFLVPHDSPGGCFGYSIYKSLHKVTLATDLGFPEVSLVDRFRDSDIVVIESNHDPYMLENSGRPEWLKKRIRERGHLSNEQCAAFVSEVMQKSRTLPSAVVLAHISQQCNTNPLAVGATSAALANVGLDIPVKESYMSCGSDVVTVDGFR